jgi:hypothetical protein
MSPHNSCISDDSCSKWAQATAVRMARATAVQNVASNSCINDTIDNCLKYHKQQLNQRHQPQLFKIDPATASFSDINDSSIKGSGSSCKVTFFL